ncbi:MAG: hypothetical protein DRG27_01195 [Deltaproteobacteria bacterium]|nr:MAG: hypothetical protein DRG27_01195 [Deltaproteobacteria bacterium]
MRSYFIDEISKKDMQKIEEFLKNNAISSPIEGLFWIQIPEQLLTKEQAEHKECAPHICALELGRDWIKLELFVRSAKSLRCTCCGYCTEEQRDFIISYANRMIDQLGVRT